MNISLFQLYKRQNNVSISSCVPKPQTSWKIVVMDTSTRPKSIYVTPDRAFLKFDARVQIYMAVLNISCEIQNGGGNVVRFSKINSYDISFWLFLFKNMRNIRFLGVW